jgi:hypothetical protein
MRSKLLRFFTFDLQSGTFFRSLSYLLTANSPWSPQPVATATTLFCKPHYHLSEGTPMIGNYSARLTGSKRNLLALLASSVIFSAGCANMSTTAPDANPFVSPATLGGRVHGGNQPVSGATVNLWFAGQSSPAIQVATTTTDSTGSFSFTKGAPDQPNSGTTDTYSCPTTGAAADPLVYVVSKGGNTQNNGSATPTNTAAAFIAVYGICSTLTSSNFVYMSEVTTVATMAAVQQFFDPRNDNITADGTGQQKIIVANLTNTINLLADPATGLQVPSTSLNASNVGNINPAVTLTASPEPGKVNLLANIISACINSPTASASNCSTLFTSAVPPAGNTTNLNPSGGFTQATDTLQALYYIFTNPSNSNSANLTALFGLAGATPPYQPSAAQPTDWTIAISYTTSGATCGTSSGGTGGFISGPVDINIDAADNVWIANSQAGGNLSAIGPNGAPFACVNFDAGTSSGGGVLDSAGNIWYGAGTTMYRYTPTTRASLAFPVTVSPLGITADGAGNVYFTAVAGSVGSLYQLPGAASAPGAVAPLQISNLVGANPMRLMADATSTTPTVTPGSIWVSSGSTFISQVARTGTTGPGVLNGFLTTPYTTSGNSYGLSISRANNIFTSAIDNGNVDQFTFNSGSGTWSPASGWPFAAPLTAGIFNPTAISVDGRSNTWLPNHATSAVSEISFFGPNALSPSTGFQKVSSYLSANRALAVDQAGNVWVAGDSNNFVTEIVGAGVPLYAPYAVGISNGRFQSIP